MQTVFYGVSCNKLLVDNIVNSLVFPLRDNPLFNVIFSLTGHFGDNSSIYDSRNFPTNETIPIHDLLDCQKLSQKAQIKHEADLELLLFALSLTCIGLTIELSEAENETIWVSTQKGFLKLKKKKKQFTFCP